MAGVGGVSPIPTSTVHDLSCCLAQPGSQDFKCLRAAFLHSTTSAAPEKAAVTPWVGRVCLLPRQPWLAKGPGGPGTAWEAAGSVLRLGGGWRNVEALSKCLGPSGTWPEFSSPSCLSYLEHFLGAAGRDGLSQHLA